MKYTLEECAPCSREEKAAYFAAKYRSHLSPSEVARIMDSGEREYQQRMAETNRQIDQERSQREQRSPPEAICFGMLQAGLSGACLLRPGYSANTPPIAPCLSHNGFRRGLCPRSAWTTVSPNFGDR